jgi:hypothetical protein
MQASGLDREPRGEFACFDAVDSVWAANPAVCGFSLLGAFV